MPKEADGQSHLETGYLNNHMNIDYVEQKEMFIILNCNTIVTLELNIRAEYPMYNANMAINFPWQNQQQYVYHGRTATYILQQ